MKVKLTSLVLFCVILVACQNDNKQFLLEQQKEAQKRETIFSNINRGWNFSITPLEPSTQQVVNHWMEWRAFLTEIEQKPKSSIGAFQKKAAALSLKATELNNNIPAEFNKPSIKARIAVLITKIKTLDLYIHINQIPDAKVVKLVGEINTEIDFFQLQMEEIITRGKIPMEEGESDIIKMKDSTRAIPDELQ
ncbi:hypothetical protein [Flavobacterium aciduliphilum]|uniref:Lipoprotein n=1 Tax=Flavobacterium aciduliphilum TaxID=1101402 RepID=A0A328YBS3_9FLAO|nr:hypothetical protein [Flavobacterium aciduliphilum]RAR71389.1 hypothetical protein CLV55_108126 [Flavobacterium aciduliphilum]